MDSIPLRIDYQNRRTKWTFEFSSQKITIIGFFYTILAKVRIAAINSSVHDKFRNRLELHHIVNHVKKGKNSADNLVTLCNVHHDLIHKVDKNGRMTVLEFHEWVELEKENYK